MKQETETNSQKVRKDDSDSWKCLMKDEDEGMKVTYKNLDLPVDLIQGYLEGGGGRDPSSVCDRILLVYVGQ